MTSGSSTPSLGTPRAMSLEESFPLHWRLPRPWTPKIQPQSLMLFGRRQIWRWTFRSSWPSSYLSTRRLISEAQTSFSLRVSSVLEDLQRLWLRSSSIALASIEYSSSWETPFPSTLRVLTQVLWSILESCRQKSRQWWRVTSRWKESKGAI